MQYGYISLSRSPEKLYKDIIFPIPFPHDCISVTASQELYPNTDSWTGECVLSKNRIGFRVQETVWSGNLRNIQGFNWIAIGY